MDLGLAGKTVLITGAAGGVLGDFLFFASDLAVCITGQQLAVDGEQGGLGY